MINNVKVSLSSVKSFTQAVAAIRDYSTQFDKGIRCLDDFLYYLINKVSSLRGAIEKMQDAQTRLASKTRVLELEISKNTERKNKLEDQLSSLKDDLETTPETITAASEDETPNPEYDSIVEEIDNVQNEIEKVNGRLFSLQKKLEDAKTVDSKIRFHIDNVNGVINSLEKKQNICKQLQMKLEEIKKLNFRQGTSAYESLKKIEEIVNGYLKIKMVYEKALVPEAYTILSSKDINVNINLNKNFVQRQKTNTEQDSKGQTISTKEIEKHKIRFDANGRISLYDGKTFGGKYNTYDARFSRTPTGDDSIHGYYEGIRGESKYIPSGRNVEGIVVKEILKQYGLDGIEYRNAEPDFEVCSEAVVKIKAMSETREIHCDPNGIPKLGNFAQADIACAKLWNSKGKDGRFDWNGRDVYEYRKANKLTWHEKCDTETMVMVRSEINLYFKHSGGCSECRMRDSGQNKGGFDE